MRNIILKWTEILKVGRLRAKTNDRICDSCDGRGEVFEDGLIACDVCNGEGKIFLEDM